ncbi:hypothetical protein Acr_25g0002000 [Actinidia rufa]|uniref:Uncharacterized protein n=1 Tax=Actinidia rufa TaxID=165716 RepID=A0A7J0GYE6_9ERIC|nr:hypothetical protein Acr_25g0002000 [Actinidia rufa]
MHLRSRYLPRPSASSPPNNRAPPMANTSQAPDLEDLHREIHGMAEQMKIMNENNARLVQLVAAVNPPPTAAPPIPDIERSHHSNRSGGCSQNLSTDRAQKGRRRSPSPPRRDRASSLESSGSPVVGSENTRRGRSPRIDTLIRQTELPFTERVLRARVSFRFKLPTQLGIYDGKTDSMDHLDSYKSLMSLQGCPDESKANKYIAAEELAEAKRRRRVKEDHKRKEPDTRRIDYREEARNKRPDRESKRPNDRRPRTPPRRPEFILAPLNASIAQVLSKIKHEEFVKWLGKIKTDPQKRNRNKYCEFYRDHRHNMEDCFQLKEQIADLIKRGYLMKYVVARPSPNFPKRRYGDNRPTAGDIQTIHGRFESGGCSTSSRKRHAEVPIDRLKKKSTTSRHKLHPFHTPLIGFGGNVTHPLGWINLPITLGAEPYQTTIWQDFIVVDCPSPYNAILGRPTLGGIKAITSTYHLKLKFPTSMGIGELKGDQRMARQCFISAMKIKTSSTPIAQ